MVCGSTGGGRWRSNDTSSTPGGGGQLWVARGLLLRGGLLDLGGDEIEVNIGGGNPIGASSSSTTFNKASAATSASSEVIMEPGTGDGVKRSSGGASSSSMTLKIASAAASTSSGVTMGSRSGDGVKSRRGRREGLGMSSSEHS